jgi:hypothetical protein
MTSPGVPNNLPIVAASSATSILTGPPLTVGKTTNSNVFATGQTNVWAAVLTERGVLVTPFTSSTPIVLPNQVGLFPNAAF